MCCYLVVHLAFGVEVRAAVGCKYPQISWVRLFCAMLLWRKPSPSSFGSHFLSEICRSSSQPPSMEAQESAPRLTAHFALSRDLSTAPLTKMESCCFHGPWLKTTVPTFFDGRQSRCPLYSYAHARKKKHIFSSTRCPSVEVAVKEQKHAVIFWGCDL